MVDVAHRKAIIIGGGIAGLAAGTLLSSKGYHVTLLEQNHRLGGRTFSFIDQQTHSVIDNGQHILMGCYTHTLKWLDWLGQSCHLTTEDEIEIPFLEPCKKLFPLTLPNLISPFHLLSAILRFRNLSVWDRFVLLRGGLAIRHGAFRPSGSVDELLRQTRQTANVIRYFWNPVCLAVMNENTETASAEMFVQALRRMFFAGRDASKIIIPRVGLSELLVTPAAELIRKNGGTIRLSTAVGRLRIEKDKITGAYLKNGELLEADWCVAAVTPGALKNIVADDIFEKVLPSGDQFKSYPIVSMYLWLDRNVNEFFEEDFVGCIGTTIQWLFRKSETCMELTVSNAGQLVHLSRAEILAIAVRELMSLFPAFNESQIAHYQIIKERSATYSAEQESMRPDQQTPIENLLVVGDWTNTGLPSTMESAVKSAHLAVEKMELKRMVIAEKKIYA
jgi:squalene-associated FAD-dependent desaturase